MPYLFQRFFLWWKRDPAKGWVILSVLSGHLLAIIVVGVSSSQLVKPKHKKLIVKTLSTPPKPSKSIAVQKKAPPKTSSSKPQAKKPSPPASSSKPKAAPPKAPTSKATPPVKKVPSPAKSKPSPSVPKEKKPPVAKPQKTSPATENLLKELEEKIAKIETTQKNTSPKTELSIPQKIEKDSLSSFYSSPTEFDNTMEDDYASFLIGYLREHLHLPELGEVTIEITLHTDGKIESLRVLKAESEKNKKYLEENLMKLKFPDFHLKKMTSNSQKLILTFCNEL